MSFTGIKKFFDYGIYSLTILLSFLLFFERYLDPPYFVSWLGHWHPLILHFPIVLILVTILQYWRGDPNISWYLAITTLFTLVSAITGLLLSLEGGTKGGLILTHQWLGVSVAYLMAYWFWFFQNPVTTKVYLGVLQSGLVILIVLTGHYGGMVTHGTEFLAFESADSNEIIPIPENPNIYTHIVQPVLNKRCVSCHNENKAKGELVLVDFDSFLKGGESGSLINKNELDNNELLKRIRLPIDHKDHMPPEKEKQLTKAELTILKEWMGQTALDNLYFSDLEDTLPLYEIVQSKIEESKTSTWDLLPEVSDNRIAELSSDYCTIQRIYNNTDALQVLIFPHSTYSPELLQNLKPIAENIIELDLSNLPLSANEIKTISFFSNIEILKMSGTSIGDDDFKGIGKLDKLRILKVYNTQLGDVAIDHLSALVGLSDLYIYNTRFTEEGISDLKSKNEGLNVRTISKETLDFKSVLPTPRLEPEKIFFREPFFVKLVHPLNDIHFNYTTDGTQPDINSPVIGDSLYIDKKLMLKYFASKNGWESSNIDSASFLKSKQIPDEYTLEQPPNPKYAGKGKSLLFDLEKGSQNFDDSTWMAFKDENFILSCSWIEEVSLKSVILSSMVNTDPHIFPPSSIEIRGGSTLNNMQLLGSIKLSELLERQNKHVKYYECAVKPTPVKYLKIVVKPLQKIPAWHQGKGEHGWFFIDEIVFQENFSENNL